MNSFKMDEILCQKCHKNIRNEILLKNNKTYHRSCSRKIKLPKEYSWDTLSFRLVDEAPEQAAA